MYKIYELDKLIEIYFEDLDVTLSTIGASIFDIKYICSNGYKSSVVEHTSIKDFSDNYFGKTCGRHSGRIANGKFKINNKLYTVENNWNNTANLHGGSNGCSNIEWKYNIIKEEDIVKVIFKNTLLESKDMFPGDLDITITYIINNNSIEIEYNANSNKDTICNLTNHTYFNLSNNNTILNHKLKINNKEYLELDNNFNPASIKKVNKTFDFNTEKEILLDINSDDLIKTNGYDHYLFFEENDFNNKSIILSDLSTKRTMEVYTTYPGVVLYTSQNDEGTILSDKILKLHGALCLECQYPPNAINLEIKDKSLLRKTDKYNEKIKFKFSLS